MKPRPDLIPERGFYYALPAKSARWNSWLKAIKPTIAMGEWLEANCQDEWLITKSPHMVPGARHAASFKQGRWDGREFQINFVSQRDAALFRMFFV